MEMIVADIFRLKDGVQTAFAVLVDPTIKLVEGGWYDLEIEGVQKESIWIDGEIFVGRFGNTPYRSVSTRESEKITRYTFRPGSWRLVGNSADTCSDQSAR